MRAPSRFLSARLARALLTSTALVGAGPALAQSILPTGGQVVSGGVTIGQPSHGALAITQSSQNAIVNWQGFSIGQQNRVDITQPNASSALLNRVTGSTPSTIAGQLNANGQVYLVNPNGITITKTGKVTAAGFVASTLDTTDEDFRAGRRQFRGSGASAKVTNQGAITIGRGGYAALIGGQVSNSGTISVPMGKVGLGSGERATLDLSGDGFLQVAVPTNAPGKGALVRSSGTISAEGGSVILTAAAARDMARRAVNMSGTIEATGVSGRNGSITLSGGEGSVAVSGRLDASSPSGKGGAVIVTGRDIGLTHARVDVSGRTGGGTVRIGGGRQGAGPLKHAANTTIDAKTVIKADATRTGNGGDVVVWSGVATRFSGTISARGGSEGGDGGEAEVSSKGVLDYTGTTILTAAKGRFGTLLLDPYNVVISNGSQTTGAGFTANANDSVINAATLSTQLGLSSVTVTTGGSGSSGSQDGNITVAAPVAWSAPTTLTLSAANAITINGTISVQGAGGVTLTYNTASPTNLSFGNGASVDYGATNNGGTLSINGQSYALVYSMADLAGINTSGRSALATSLFATSDGTANGTPTAYTGPIVGTLTGTFEGLGHTISNLTISSTANNAAVGLFGTVTGGTVRDIGLVGGTVTGSGDNTTFNGGVGALVGVLTTIGNGTPASVVNAFSTTTVSGGLRANVGGLVGQAVTRGAPTLIANSYATGNVSAGQYGNVGGLVGQNYANASPATISGSYATGAVSTGDSGYAGGLTAANYAFTDNAYVINSHATGAVSGGSNAQLGGLVSQNFGRLGATASISNAYATGTVGSSNVGYAGGLVANNSTASGYALISNAYATGAVSGFITGGLVGLSSAGSFNGATAVAAITDAYATGAVSGVKYGQTGGLIGLLTSNGGNATASVTNAYSTGQVTGVSGNVTYIGGSIGWTYPSGGTISVSNVYWDKTTSGQPGPNGIGVDSAGQQGNVVGLTTRQLQGLDPLSGNTYFSTTAQLGNTTTSAFAGGAGGLYPYLANFFPGGVQAVSGYVYADGGTTPLASGNAGTVVVDVLAGGTTFGSAATGANGYYYAFGAAGSLPTGRSVLATTNANGTTGATDAAALVTATGAANTAITLYGHTLGAPTSQATLSAAIPDARNNVIAAAGGNAKALSAIQGTTDYDLVSSASSFTVDQAVTTSNRFGVQTTATNAPITVAQPITIGSGGGVALNAAGALAFNAPVTVNGAGSATLGYNTSDAANLSFAIGAPLSFTGSGGALAINGNPYTLIYNATGLQNINSGLTGRYALATDIDASNASGFVPLGTDGSVATDGSNVLNGGNGFTGTFTGLGHTIDSLSIQAPQTKYVGLFGYLGAGGLVQNVGVTNADIHGVGTLGAIAGYNAGTVTQSYATGQIYATASGLANDPVAAQASGGLIGENAGLLSNSFSTVTVNARDTNQGGGAVGFNNEGTVSRVYASGAVDIGSGGSGAGGLVGYNLGYYPYLPGGVVTDSYATGAVYGGANVGGLVGYNGSNAVVSGAYDSTTGRASGIGGGVNGSNVNVVGLTTSTFQNGGASGLSAAYGGGAGGLYPYLNSFYPRGVQAISGIAYRNGATGALASGMGRDAGLVTVMGNGTSLNTVSTGANGYYYVAVPTGTLAAAAPVLAYTVANTSSGATNAATVTGSTGGATLAGVDIYGNTLSGTVSDTTLSAANTSLVSNADAAAGSNAAALGAISNATGRYFVATGSSFTIDQTVSTTGLFGVRTTAANAPITVAQAITVNTSDSLWLQASGTLAINAPISVTGAGSVTLAASLDTTTAAGVSLLNLSFAPGVSIDYGATNNGGTLSINGQSYGLLYSMSDVANVNNALAERYALATNLDATGNSYTGAVIAPGIPYNAAVFSGTLDGLGHSIANLSISNTADQVSLGLVGLNTGTIRDLSLVGGSLATTGIANSTGALVGFNQGVIANVSSSVNVTGGVRADYIGGLVGFSDGSSGSVAIVNAAATGAVSITSGNVGGLVGLQQGRNGYTATIANSYATGQVSAVYGDTGGGLVGISQAVDGGTAAITNSYATGNVSIGGQTSVAGGLVGNNAAVRGGAVASLTNVYATGVVSVSGSQATAGALIGVNGIYSNGSTPDPVTPIVNAFWDVTTSGRTNAFGSDNASQAANVTGLTTRQLQGLDPISGSVATNDAVYFSTATNLGNGTTSAFAGGFDGLYPYLSSFFPSGVQVISGYAYADAGLTPSSPRTIGVIGGGAPFASASSGANGYYYAFGQNGTIASGASVLVHNGVNAATLISKDGATGQSVNLYGNALTIDTSATSLSTAPTLADAQTAALTAAGGNVAAQTAINAAGGRGFIASGASFTVDQAISGPNTFYLQTNPANAGITVSQPITIGSGGGGLALLASGALAINAPVTINGAGTANLAYDASSPTNLSFAQGTPLTFANADGSAATGAVTGQALTINGQSYTLLYTMTDVASVNTLGLGGSYALATNIDANGTIYTTGVIAGGDRSGDRPAAFSGIFEGLGHTVSNLTIDAPSNSYVGLIGYSTGAVRDIGVVGGSVTAFSNAGSLLGDTAFGSVTNVYATGAVSGGEGSSNLGGLVGTVSRGSSVTNAYATGAVSGGNGSSGLGGLVGSIDSGTITNAYASGAVIAGQNSSALGGLVGFSDGGSVVNAYATGAVGGGDGSSGLGGLVGARRMGSVTNGYWDIQTSGLSVSAGGGTGLTTRQLQGLDPISGSIATNDAVYFSPSTNLGDGTNTAFAGGTGGLYPYLSSFFPNGVQAISGTAYRDAGVTLAASNAAGSVSVGLIADNQSVGSATAGANGYYYIIAPAGTAANGTNNLLAYSTSLNAAALANVRGTSVTGLTIPQTGVDLYGNAVTVPTDATSLTSYLGGEPLARAQSTAQRMALTADTTNGAASAAITGATGLGLVTSGGSFTIDTPLTISSTFLVQTRAGAPITVAAGDAITIGSGGSLGLLSNGALTVNAPVTAKGAATVALGFDASNPTNLSFGLTGSGFAGGLTFAKADGSTASSSQGGALAVNGQSYTLLYNLGSVGASDAIQDIDTLGLSGRYALATNLDGTGTTFTSALVGANYSYSNNTGAFVGTFEGLGHTIGNLTIASTTDYANLGLFSVNTGTIRNIGLVAGTVSETGYAPNLGLLAGRSLGDSSPAIIANAYATGTARSSGGAGNIGGLVGASYSGSSASAAIINSYASVAVSGGQGGNVGGFAGSSSGFIGNSYATGSAAISQDGTVGGLIGQQSGGSIASSYATGAVIGGNASVAGGLIGLQSIFSDTTTVSNVYATGVVVGAPAETGGLIGRSIVIGNGGGSITLANAYWDTTTSGQANGIGNDQVGQSSNVIGLTTRQLQGLDPINGNAFSVVNALGDSTASAFAGGANGLYPYLSGFFPNGVQAVSGTVYSDTGLTPLASGANGAVTVGVIGNNAALGTGTTGANGYYYVFGAAGTLSNGQNILAYTTANGATGAKNAATLTASTGLANETGINIYGDALTISTTANALSAAPSLADARTGAAAAAGGNADALAAIGGAQGRSLIATNGDFVIDEAVTTGNTFRVQTTAANAAITTSGAITIADGGRLGLLASGALRVDAPITAQGAVPVHLAYDASDPTNLSFAQGASLTFMNAQVHAFRALAAAPPSSGGSLTINGTTYTLLYTMADVENVNNGLTGNYALANDIDSGGNIYATGIIAGGTVSANPTPFSGVFDGLGHTISNLTIAGSGNNYVGLIGLSSGTVRDIGLIGASVAGAAYVGGLVGFNGGGTIAQAYAAGAVSGQSFGIGGLVGENAGLITRAYATGSVSGYANVGGLVGSNDGGGTITQAYATGAVSGSGGTVGGLAGYNSGTIGQAYTTGAVSGRSGAVDLGGLVGFNDQNGTIAQAYYDRQTSGRATGIGQDYNTGNPQAGNVIGLTTRQLQGLDPVSGSPFSVVNALGDGTTSAFAGGANGLYPYLTSFAPNGVQAFSGTAYSDGGATPLASNGSGAVTIGLLADGASVGQASTGANGYYYVAVPLGAPLTPVVNNGQNLLAYTAGSAPAAATLVTASGGRLQIGLDLYGNALTVETAATRFSQAPQTAGDARTVNALALATAAGTVKDAKGAIINAVGLGLRPTGAGFSIDQTPTINGVLAIQTCACAPITIDAPITVADGQSLGLLSGGALTVNAPIAVDGAATLALAYDTASPANFALRAGTTISFNDVNGGATGNAVPGQGLAINGQPYTLLYSMADIEGIGGNTAAGGIGGLYALANDLTATTRYTDALVSPSTGPLSGVLEGFNHGITGLTIDKTNNGSYAGLIGLNYGTIRDIALIGGTITGQSYAGTLAGQNNGTIFNASSSANVSANGRVGGLVGLNFGTITQASAAGTVSGDFRVGGLVGLNDGGTITQASATGTVSGNFYVGGLVGQNTGTITQVYATGAVLGGGRVGGLVGDAERGTITQAYATGAVSGGDNVGGLVGVNVGAITQAYATGAVSSQGGSGGLVAQNYGPITQAYWDTQTSGKSFSASGGIGLTTRQLQGLDPLPGGGTMIDAIHLGSAFAGGAGGLYPYLASFFPGGVQAVSGTAYKDGGVTPLASGRSGPGIVSIASDGSVVGSTTTGANGYYYYVAPAGTLSSRNGVAAFTVANVNTGATDAVSYASGTPGTVASLDISGGWRRDTTALTSLSALNAGFTVTMAGTPAASFSLPSRAIDAAGAFSVDTVFSITDTLALNAGGALTQTRLITAPKLLITGTGAVALTQANQIGTLAANLASLDLANTGALTIGRITSADGIAVFGVATTDAVKVATSGDLTLASAAPVSGASPVLATGGAFVNDAGAKAVTATSGRWLIYSADPANDTFGSLNSGNAAVWNIGPAGAISAAGNRYVFAKPQTLTFTSTDATKIYGENANAALAGVYSVTGYAPGVADAYLGDTAATAFSGAPVISSTGAAANAEVAGSPYGIAVAKGTLTSASGYGFTFVNAGELTVTPRAITIKADAQSRAYGDENPALTYAIGGMGLVNGNSLTGTLATSATTTSDVGHYGIMQGTLAASPNYALTYVGADLAVTPRHLTITPDAQSRLYGDANPALTYTVGGYGLVNGDALTGGLATSATSASGIGSYAIARGSLTASGNYAVTYDDADLSVTSRPLTVTADAQSRPQGVANPVLTYTIGGAGLVNGDALTGGLATAAEGTSAVGSYPIIQGSLAASANYALTYAGANLTVTARPTTSSGSPIDATGLASTVARELGERGFIPAGPGGLPASGPAVPPTIAASDFGFAGLADPRFQGIVVCTGGNTGSCYVAPVPPPRAAAPRPQAAR